VLSDVFTNIYAVVFWFLLFVGLTKAQQMQVLLYKIKAAAYVMSSPTKQVKAKAD
jgi:hypothetical protein